MHCPLPLWQWWFWVLCRRWGRAFSGLANFCGFKYIALLYNYSFSLLLVWFLKTFYHPFIKLLLFTIYSAISLIWHYLLLHLLWFLDYFIKTTMNNQSTINIDPFIKNVNDSYYRYYKTRIISIINAYMNNHKCSIYCDEASNTRRSYVYSCLRWVHTDMARIYVLRKLLPCINVARET